MAWVRGWPQTLLFHFGAELGVPEIAEVDREGFAADVLLNFCLV